jgi:hypothetical protein
MLGSKDKKSVEELAEDCVDIWGTVIKEPPMFTVGLYYEVKKINGDIVDGKCIWCEGEWFQIEDCFGIIVSCNKKFSKSIKESKV